MAGFFVLLGAFFDEVEEGAVVVVVVKLKVGDSSGGSPSTSLPLRRSFAESAALRRMAMVVVLFDDSFPSSTSAESTQTMTEVVVASRSSGETADDRIQTRGKREVVGWRE